MPLLLIDKVIWAGSFALNLTLLGVLIFRRQARSVPWFTALIAFGSLRTVVLFLIFLGLGRHRTYFLAYWYAAGIDLLLQISVLLEIAKKIFKRSDGWVPGARRSFTLYCSFAPITALALALLMKPAARSALDEWDARASVFMTVLICVMCRAVMTVSKHLGLGWQSKVTRLMYGLVVWSVASFITDTLHAYWRTIDQFGRLENTVVGMYQLVTVYWIWVFWKPDVVALPLPEATKNDLGRLGERLTYGSSTRSQ